MTERRKPNTQRRPLPERADPAPLERATPKAGERRWLA